METNVIYVDCTCSENPGKGGWRVKHFNQYVIEKEMDFGTNNLFEYFAIIDALKWLKSNHSNSKFTIYPDSQTALSWVKRRKVNTGIEQSVKRKWEKSIEGITEQLNEGVITPLQFQRQKLNIDNNLRSNLLKVEEIKKIVLDTEAFLNNYDFSFVAFKKWNTKLLGENPADYGRKSGSKKPKKRSGTNPLPLPKKKSPLPKIELKKEYVEAFERGWSPKKVSLFYSIKGFEALELYKIFKKGK